jgi:hypothetical protein
MSGAWWLDPEYRERQSDTIRAKWRDPEYRRLQSESRRAKWQDPTYRARVLSALSSGLRARGGRCPTLCSAGRHQCVGPKGRVHDHEFIATCVTGVPEL